MLGAYFLLYVDWMMLKPRSTLINILDAEIPNILYVHQSKYQAYERDVNKVIATQTEGYLFTYAPPHIPVVTKRYHYL